MLKYIKYLISPLTMIMALFAISFGAYFPLIFLIAYSLFKIFGDLLIGKDIIARFGEIHPVFLNDFDIKTNVNGFEIFLETTQHFVNFAPIIKGYFWYFNYY